MPDIIPMKNAQMIWLALVDFEEGETWGFWSGIPGEENDIILAEIRDTDFLSAVNAGSLRLGLKDMLKAEMSYYDQPEGNGFSRHYQITRVLEVAPMRGPMAGRRIYPSQSYGQHEPLALGW